VSDHRPALVPLDDERAGHTDHMDGPIGDFRPFEDVAFAGVGIPTDHPTRAREVSGEVVICHLTAPRG